MTPITCSYCAGPICGAACAGRPWPGRAAAAYCCFGCLDLGERRRGDEVRPGGRSGWLGVRLGVGILVAGQSMVFGLALNLHDDVPADVRRFAQSFILLATLVVFALLGPPLVRAAWGELRRGRLTVEALFLLTMTGAMAASLQAHLTGRGHIYFEVVAVLLVVYTLGKLIGARSRAAAVARSRSWAGQGAVCRVVTSGGVLEVPVRDVQPGEVVEVNPGDAFPVDGVIRTGIGFASEAAVSGEPFPVVRRPGDTVSAGAVSHDAAFHVEATAPGGERRIDRLLAAVDAARDRPLSLQARADRLGRWFFPLVVAVAAGTFAYWTFAAGWETGLFNAMAVLLVACPCAIGLATPVVVWAAVGRLAERGLIVRSGDAVERLAAANRVFLDKTGTLTEDRFALLDVVTAATGAERAKVLGWLAAVQSRSNHPVAKAFAELPQVEVEVRSLNAVPGCGVEAEVVDIDGTLHSIRIGRAVWIGLDEGGNLAAELHAIGHRVDVAVDGELAAVAVVAERLRDATADALADFATLRLPVEVLTGDANPTPSAVPVRAGLLPEDKLRIVREAAGAGGRPLMVGDGINDAAALAEAHVGIALASGTDLAVGAAHATLYHGDLRVLPWAVQLSRAAVRAVNRNLVRAVAFNLIGMMLAACGLLHPVAAVLLMTASSLWLVFSSTRIASLPDHCESPAESGFAWRSLPHGIAFALQGVLVCLLLEEARGWPVVAGFALVGVGLAWVWHRWEAVPHRIDMCFGMLTVGNLGMLLGWWADAGFAPLPGGCCACAASDASGIGMWLGMLVAANAAMLGLGRRPLRRGPHAAAMCTGGNLGMVAGMLAGGWAAGRVPCESAAVAFALAYLGMTLGMYAGMLLGTAIVEPLLRAALALVSADSDSRRNVQRHTEPVHPPRAYRSMK